MERINTANVATGNDGQNLFSSGNLSLGIPATQFSDRWCNAIQEEIATAIETYEPLDSGSHRQLHRMISLTESSDRVITGFTLSTISNGTANLSASIGVGTLIYDRRRYVSTGTVTFPMTSDRNYAFVATGDQFTGELEIKSLSAAAPLFPAIPGTGAVIGHASVDNLYDATLTQNQISSSNLIATQVVPRNPNESSLGSDESAFFNPGQRNYFGTACINHVIQRSHPVSESYASGHRSHRFCLGVENISTPTSQYFFTQSPDLTQSTTGSRNAVVGLSVKTTGRERGVGLYYYKNQDFAFRFHGTGDGSKASGSLSELSLGGGGADVDIFQDSSGRLRIQWTPLNTGSFWDFTTTIDLTEVFPEV